MKKLILQANSVKYEIRKERIIFTPQKIKSFQQTIKIQAR